MLDRWAARTPGAPRHERRARGRVQPRRDRAPAGDMLASFMAGMTAGWVTGMAPPACPRRRANPVQAGDARGWYYPRYPRAPHTGQAPMPWLARTFWATAICWAAVAWFAEEAYRPPPLAIQVCSVNCRPP